MTTSAWICNTLVSCIGTDFAGCTHTIVFSSDVKNCLHVWLFSGPLADGNSWRSKLPLGLLKWRWLPSYAGIGFSSAALSCDINLCCFRGKDLRDGWNWFVARVLDAAIREHKRVLFLHKGKILTPASILWFYHVALLTSKIDFSNITPPAHFSSDSHSWIHVLPREVNQSITCVSMNIQEILKPTPSHHGPDPS